MEFWMRSGSRFHVYFILHLLSAKEPRVIQILDCCLLKQDEKIILRNSLWPRNMMVKFSRRQLATSVVSLVGNAWILNKIS